MTPYEEVLQALQEGHVGAGMARLALWFDDLLRESPDPDQQAELLQCFYAALILAAAWPSVLARLTPPERQ